MSLYQSDRENLASTYEDGSCASSSSNFVTTMFVDSASKSKTFHFDSAKSLASPCPFTSFVGLISMSYS
jgi:hypothetical protein